MQHQVRLVNFLIGRNDGINCEDGNDTEDDQQHQGRAYGAEHFLLGF